MNATINIRTDAKTKGKAQKLAEQLGFSLSSLINAYLKDFVRKRTVDFSLEEKPNAYLRRILKQAEKNIKRGKLISFAEPEDALKYLDDLIAKESD